MRAMGSWGNDDCNFDDAGSARKTSSEEYTDMIGR
jgi:hypothetical protein